MWNNLILGYLIVVNTIGIIFMGIDKNKAQNNRWRIKEKTFFILALIGGSLGILLGMRVFRHKTKHLKFTLGTPMLLAINIIFIYYLYELIL